MPFIRDEKSLERVSGDMAFSRGRSYYRNGAVKRIARKDNYLEGYVQGSEPEAFLVRILFRDFDNFRSAECSCPFKLGSMCKHSVAVLLHWLHYVAINEKVDVSTLILLDERQLKANSLIAALPSKSSVPLDKIITNKKINKSVYLLPEYQHRASPKPKIQIVLSINGFIGGVTKSIPFKIFINVGEKKIAVTNLKVFFNNSRTRNIEPIALSMFSARQQYVLSLLNEFLTIENGVSGFIHSQFRIKRMQWAVFLEVIANCPGIEFIESKTNQPIEIKTKTKISVSIKIRRVENGLWGVSASFKDPQNPENNFSNAHLQEGHPVWLLDESSLKFYLVDQSITYSFIKDFLNTEKFLDDLQIPYFMSEVLDPLKSSCDIIDQEDCLKNILFIKPSLRCRLDLVYVNTSLRAKLTFVYENQGYYPYEGKSSMERFVKLDNQNDLRWVVRDNYLENNKLQSLRDDCMFEWRKNARVFEITGTESVLDFIYQKLPSLKNEMDIYYPKDFEAKLLNNKFFEPVVRLTGSGIDWFEFDAVYKIDGIDEEIQHSRIKKLIMDGQNYIKLKKGEILPIPREFFNKIEALNQEFESKKLHIAQIPFVMEELKKYGLNSTVDSEVKAIYDELKKFQSIESGVLPESLSNVLRDYQVKGVDWLSFLRKFHFGGVLADEMGLGKTLQALTMIQLEIEQGNKNPSLVVCPTTLVWNWQEEIKKFLPNVKVLILIGNQRRDLFGDINKAQVVITSYSLLRRDIELYKKVAFNYVLLDEAQNIKNRNTRNALVAKSLNASMRLAMTGTPVENSIMDLWSIFDFLMPGFLGGAEKFKRRYEIPITKFQDKDQLEKLSSRILPFVLRRLKKDVVKDLPEKIEQVSYCELEPTQAKIYAKMIESARKIASKSVDENGFEKSRMIILTLILRLRQICCHPLIAGVDLGHRSVSGKMELLKETLEELLAGGHKVLIFSQFVSMLKIMEEYLIREKIPYAYMDGSSKDRQEEVARFNADPSIKVFLLSLKVGGVGLNLTSADTVIIYEPWWNPAVENQAIDRVHRIGQEVSVLAYRMITKGTIEEKMLELQNRKRFLMDALVLSEASIGKKLDWEDIKFLLDMK